MRTNPILLTDGYKLSHADMYPKGTTLVYTNGTPRSNKHAPKGIDKVLSCGQEAVIQWLHAEFRDNFFGRPRHEVLDELKGEISLYLGKDYDISRFAALYDLGYLPIVVKTLPEGVEVPMRVPIITLYNTHPDFFWVTNFLETIISNMLWLPMTSATTALHYKKILTKWMKATDRGKEGFVDCQAHDFAMRGMGGLMAAILSGIGHAFVIKGSDCLPVISNMRKYYTTDLEKSVIESVNASEHAVMCAGSKENELETYRRLMQTFPEGILSVVSDTWDLWNVLTNILPQLKDEILTRNGKLVIRPDSGDPVDILCGIPKDQWTRSISEIPKQKGVIELLWDVFGGTVNEQGFKVLDPHIGAIYGDSITPERAEAICQRLADKGFASTNVVFGVGSYTYQYKTRDTFGFAMKATYVERTETVPALEEDEMPTTKIIGEAIYKDPVTDDGTKKSATGLLYVGMEDGEYYLKDNVTWEEEATGCLQPIYKDGKFIGGTRLDLIRSRIQLIIENE